VCSEEWSIPGGMLERGGNAGGRVARGAGEKKKTGLTYGSRIDRMFDRFIWKHGRARKGRKGPRFQLCDRDYLCDGLG